MYKIRWKNYGPKDDTWEEHNKLCCPDILERYNIKVTTFPPNLKSDKTINFCFHFSTRSMLDRRRRKARPRKLQAKEKQKEEAVQKASKSQSRKSVAVQNQKMKSLR